MPSRAHRITQGDDYRRIVRGGRRMSGTYLVSHIVSRPQEFPIRFGYITSKKVGGAVTRNLVRRRLKGISDEIIQAGYSGADIVFRVRPEAASAPFSDLRREVMRHIHATFQELPEK